MEKLKINGNFLAYERLGIGAPLILVHGFPLDQRSWEPLLPHLKDTFDLILPDLHGFGQSDVPDGTYGVEQMAADLASLLDALGIQKTYIAGHSMGGYVALSFARAFPQRVLGLGLIGSQAAPDAPERKSGRYATAEQVALQGFSAVMEMAEKLSANPGHAPFFRELIQSQRPEGIIGALKAIAERPDSLPLIPTFHFPLVLVHGLADTLVSSERAREIKELSPHATLTELPGVGHSPQLEAPAATAHALQKFISWNQTCPPIGGQEFIGIRAYG